ncbi:TMM72 protein, partial [Atractosteus spatula]|nr:TMM72 protein [Atractosteus spatula]
MSNGSVSSGGVAIFEVSYFADKLLGPCLPCPSGSRAFILWKKAARLGGFQKFLYYTLMSVVCFLHPVLVWHAVIPGVMLLITGVANFILSKRKKANLPQLPPSLSELYSDPSGTTVSVTAAGNTEQTYSFHRAVSGSRTTAWAHLQRLFHRQGPGAKSQAQLDHAVLDGKPGRGKGKQVHFQENAVQIIPDVSEMLDFQEMETTSDKAPIIRP